MELFGKQISRNEAAVCATVGLLAIGGLVALDIWGGDTIGISSKTLCQENSPMLVRSSGAAVRELSRAEIQLFARYQTGVGTAEQQAAAKLAVNTLGSKNDQGEVVLKPLDPDNLTCTVESKNGDLTGLSPQAEQMVGQLQAAGVEVDFSGRH
ncbi:MAG TPA: hypothetical protein VMT23_04055 [Candidatus Binatia bacterium]|nr:hypothetical protein [Candidatus Binatia bacterium]